MQKALKHQPSIFAVREITHKNNDEETRGKLEQGAAHQYTMMHFDAILVGTKN